MKYLFSHWDKLKKKLVGKQIFLFLDYDGTLTPIVSTPEKAVIPRRAKKLLKLLSTNPKCKLAIVSGRSLRDVKQMVGVRGVIYAGNHGWETTGPGINFENPISPRAKALIREVKNKLKRKLPLVKGMLLEDKGFTLSLHYRLVNKKDLPLLKTIFYIFIGLASALLLFYLYNFFFGDSEKSFIDKKKDGKKKDGKKKDGKKKGGRKFG